MHRSKRHRHSITSSARTRKDFGDGQAERLGGLEIDDQLEPLRILDWQIGWPWRL
jgi:hypothetical protein